MRPIAGSGWTPTTDAINALPAPVRRYIHDLETRCDPAGEVAALTLTRDQNEQLAKALAEERTRREAAEAAIVVVRQCLTREASLRGRADALLVRCVSNLDACATIIEEETERHTDSSDECQACYVRKLGADIAAHLGKAEAPNG